MGATAMSSGASAKIAANVFSTGFCGPVFGQPQGVATRVVATVPGKTNTVIETGYLQTAVYMRTYPDRLRRHRIRTAKPGRFQKQQLN
jgi:hypothetical protein